MSTPKQLFAAIDLGAHSLRLAVAEVSRRGYKKLESLNVPVDLGRDSFAHGRISNKALEDVTTYLSNFRSKLDEYKVRRYRAVATSAVREAENQDLFLDRMAKRGKIDFEIIEGAEEARLVDQRLEALLAGRLGYDTKTCLMLALGAGTCLLNVRRKGSMLLSETHPFGTLRFLQIARRVKKPLDSVIASFVERATEQLQRVYELASTDRFFVVHDELPRLLAKIARSKEDAGVVTVTHRNLQALAGPEGLTHPEELVERHGIRFEEAETLSVSLNLIHAFLELTRARSIHFPEVTLIDGLLYDEQLRIAGKRPVGWASIQAAGAALALGKKYNFDLPHAEQVQRIALQLFDELAEFCGLLKEDRSLLSLAAILHDIGVYVNPRSHHKHSAYLITHSELMGLSSATLELVAQVARYHRRATPKPQHQEFQRLGREDRLRVRKLASLLRIADSLDRDHGQRIHSVRVELASNEVAVVCQLPPQEELGVNEWALQQKSDMFESLFGVKVTCRGEST